MTGNDQLARIWRKLSSVNRSTIPEFLWPTKGQYSGRTRTGHLLHRYRYKWTRDFCCKDVQTNWHLDNNWASRSTPFFLAGQCALNPHDWSLQVFHEMWRRRQEMLTVITGTIWRHTYKHIYIHTYVDIHIPISIDIHAHIYTYIYTHIRHTNTYIPTYS
jgi:hypothetical protein